MSLPFLVPESKQPSAEDAFLIFWANYPRKLGKFDAQRAWKKIKPEEMREVLDGLTAWNLYWKQSATEMQFIPYPATWLRHRRWEDVEPAAEQTEKKSTGLKLVEFYEEMKHEGRWQDSFDKFAALPTSHELKVLYRARRKESLAS